MGNVATLGRRDVTATSLPWSPLLQNCFYELLFLLECTCIQTKHQIRNLATKLCNYCKINVKMKDRREYNMSVLGTHHTPKLSFLLVPKQEWTLSKTHIRPTKTNTKTVLHMLRNRGSIWTDSHCRCFARSSQNAYKYLTYRKLG